MSTKFTRNNVALNSTNVRVPSVKQHCTHHLLNGLYGCAPGAAKQLVARLFFSPGSYRLSRVEKAFLDKGRESNIRVHGKTIRIWKWGDGPGILFVHGWNGSGIQFHQYFEPLINAGFSVIAYDAPAHGASEGKTTNYFELSEAVKAILATLDDQPVHAIVAHSLGASAVINCLSTRKRPVKTVLVAPALRLKDMVYRTLEHYGVPNRICRRLIADAEARFGYDFEIDDPHRLIPSLKGPILVLHDKGDRVVSHEETCGNLDGCRGLSLFSTVGLGHKQILMNRYTMKVILDFLLSANGYVPNGLATKKRQIGNWI